MEITLGGYWGDPPQYPPSDRLGVSTLRAGISLFEASHVPPRAEIHKKVKFFLIFRYFEYMHAPNMVARFSKYDFWIPWEILH